MGCPQRRCASASARSATSAPSSCIGPASQATRGATWVLREGNRGKGLAVICVRTLRQEPGHTLTNPVIEGTARRPWRLRVEASPPLGGARAWKDLVADPHSGGRAFGSRSLSVLQRPRKDHEPARAIKRSWRDPGPRPHRPARCGSTWPSACSATRLTADGEPASVETVCRDASRPVPRGLPALFIKRSWLGCGRHCLARRHSEARL